MNDEYKFLEYLRAIDYMIKNEQCFLCPPESPLGDIAIADDGSFGIEIRNKNLMFKKGYLIKYSEHGKTTVSGEKYTIFKYSYHFEGRKKGLHAFRFDKGLNEIPHANHEKYNKSWPHFLYYPKDIEFNNLSFCLVCMIKTCILYIETMMFPLENKNAGLYNRENNKIRGELMWS